MSTPTEDRLTRALGAQATVSGATDERWDAVVARAHAIRHRDTGRRAVALLTAAAVVLGALVLVRLDRGGEDGRITVGTQPPATADPTLTARVRAGIVLADAVTDEAVATFADPAAPPGEIAAARAATDRAGAAWRGEADRPGADVDPLVSGASNNLRSRLDALTTVRHDW